MSGFQNQFQKLKSHSSTCIILVSLHNIITSVTLPLTVPCTDLSTVNAGFMLPVAMLPHSNRPVPLTQTQPWTTLSRINVQYMTVFSTALITFQITFWTCNMYFSLHFSVCWQSRPTFERNTTFLEPSSRISFSNHGVIHVRVAVLGKCIPDQDSYLGPPAYHGYPPRAADRKTATLLPTDRVPLSAP